MRTKTTTMKMRKRMRMRMITMIMVMTANDNADTVVDQRFFYSSMHNCTRQYSGLIIHYL